MALCGGARLRSTNKRIHELSITQENRFTWSLSSLLSTSL